MTDEELMSGFNQHMQSNGMLADGPKEYSENFGKRWLVTEYEAGDVVLHTPYTVRGHDRWEFVSRANSVIDTRINYEL